MNRLILHLYHSSPQTNSIPSPPLRSKLLSLCESGDLFTAIRFLNSVDLWLLPSKPIIFASLLQASTRSFSFPFGLQIHSHILKSGLDADRFVGNSLLSFYFKLCPNISDTRKVFDLLPVKDVISWTSMVSGYVRAGLPVESLKLFISMSDFGVEPNAFTLSSVVKASTEMENLGLGQCFHGLVTVRGFSSNGVISSALVDLYGRNSRIEDARQLFAEMHAPDAICWTSMISAFTQNDIFEEALVFFRCMLQRIIGLVPDEFLLGTILCALGNLARSRLGKEAHAKVITSGLSGRVVVESSIVDMYAKCGLLDDSRQVFDRLENKNAVSWCALLGGYCQNGEFQTVLVLFQEMDEDDNQYSFSTVLRACAGLAAVMQGKELHCRFIRIRGGRNVVIESALVDLYAKCGLVGYAHRVFSNATVKNLITWNAMICGFAQNGQAEKAIELFGDMIEGGTRPDYVTFVAVLFACSHTGMVEEGKKHFKSMNEEYGIRAGIEHYNCMVDLLSRAGMLEEAETLVLDSAYRDDSSLWASLLGACATHRSPAVAERVAKKMIELEPGYHLSYVLLTNVYKTVGRWNDALEIRKLMRKRGVRKEAGRSWIGAQNSKLENQISGNILHGWSVQFEEFGAGVENDSCLQCFQGV
ncbi:pentatricopeptide repeat-containing protein At1g03540 [Phalaenopsis equestris]|uniref:pentatricopeptide repeat-containing protein At1g03540 n=1 Tax=Phalaenopsis equestris TaxID=78828 RepID=UPI0009E578D3|nr:pentatricopeptide repeat-containing protein At1g03540 [Phalaenopsis equestris]XP_020576619.1 pentatricopeptide repeat-containing protein At1g03540 [Phalaenopsis equestris]XP_020576620.1 pentatricopeptide repeat-containing protein At1g03540 [Phalaenopsis equestris]